MVKTAGKKYTKRRHYFFLNPYKDTAFTKCPKCQSKTKLRKFPLVVHIEVGQLLFLNKLCRYCPTCDLIIVKKSDVESLMAACFEERNPKIVGNDYLVIGVADRKDWREGKKGTMPQSDAIDCVQIFKDVLHFEPVRPTWVPPERTK